MIVKIIHAHKCYECNGTITTVADYQEVNGTQIWRHTKCVPLPEHLKNLCTCPRSAGGRILYLIPECKAHYPNG